MKRNSGEVVIGLLIGLAIGGIMAFMAASNEAQEVANATGQEQEVLPRVEWSKVLVTGAAGAGIGWAVDQLGGDSGGGRNTSINVKDNDGNVNINVGDSSEDNDSTVRTDNADSNNSNF